MPYCARCGSELASSDAACRNCAAQEEGDQTERPAGESGWENPEGDGVQSRTSEVRADSDGWTVAGAPGALPVAAAPQQPAPYTPGPSFRQGASQQTSWALWSLILGIVGVAVPCLSITGPFAIWTGVVSNRNGENSGMALAGIILGCVACLSLLAVLGYIIFMVVFVGGMAALGAGSAPLSP